jgi:hypothetical protein
MIAGAQVTGMGIFEETITDVNLMKIALAHPNHVLTRKFTRREEGDQSGADWLWCIGRPGRWFSMLVQAKIVNPATGRCHYLDYRKGEQRRRLIEFARTYRLYATYCIYSSLPHDVRPFDPRGISGELWDSVEPADWACTLVAPRYVKLLVDAKMKTQDALLNLGVPWSFPFNVDNSTLDKDPVDYITERLAGARARLLDHVESSKRKHRRMKRPASRIQWDDVDPSLLVTKNLPSIVTRLLRGNRGREMPISYVSVISTVPVTSDVPELRALSAANRLTGIAFRSLGKSKVT